MNYARYIETKIFIHIFKYIFNFNLKLFSLRRHNLKNNFLISLKIIKIIKIFREIKSLQSKLEIV